MIYLYYLQIQSIEKYKIVDDQNTEKLLKKKEEAKHVRDEKRKKKLEDQLHKDDLSKYT